MSIETIDTPDIEVNDPHVQQEETQMEIKLVSRLPDKYQIPSEKMVIPGSLTRLDLSDLINDSLALEKRIPFDFLINGEYLRGSISTHCYERGILSEKTLEVEYVIAMEEPESSDLTEPQNDWISGLAVEPTCFYTCAMNGVVMKYDNESGKPIASSGQSSLPMTGVAVTETNTVVSTSKDGHIRFGDSNSLTVFESGKLAEGIQCLALCPFDHTLVITGSVSGSVHLWNVPVYRNESNKPSKKRSAVKESEPRQVLIETGSTVSALHWVSLSRVVIGCLDGSIHIVDAMSGHSVPSISTNRSISALTCIGSDKLVTGHPDGRIIFWNLRCDGTSASIEAINSCRSQSRMISSLAARPGDDCMIASGCIDGTIKFFDSRASHFAVQSVAITKGERVLAVAWTGPSRLLSGSSDGVVRSHSIKATSE